MNQKSGVAVKQAFRVLRALAWITLAVVLALFLKDLFAFPVSQSPSQSQQPNPQSLTDSPLVIPGEWQVYIGESGSYSIRYPPNWIPVPGYSDNEGIIFRLAEPTNSQSQLLIGVSVHPLPPGWDLERIVEAKAAHLSGSKSTTAARQTAMIDGEKATEIVGREERFRLIENIVIREGLLYTLWAQPYDPEHPLFGRWVTDLDIVFHTMVSSFQFAN